ncbi:MAG: L-arabinose ABC transporter permease AraH [Verrucomicrobiota bacterium]|jgi:L-arabinose transport system permease protein|nr:L-arabinose ABC transporter permease AraH [Verrucomicrobiota bacterium]MDD8049900.1 L-arabinose ABC transporter permease AraH [Verrucomicrobiota bacterium]MDI9382807.1 L-arabinose ABC transporter permease AraH [Verrucomicrobiota bacterium]
MKQKLHSTNRVFDLADQLGMLLVFALVFLFCSLTVDYFFTLKNMSNLALSVSWLGIVACSMLFCLASGDFDLSVGAVWACAGVMTGLALNATGSVAIGIAAGLGLGAAVGLVNGVVIAKFKINALITTLATMQIIRGIGQISSGGQSVNVSDEAFLFLGQGQVAGVPFPVVITIVCFVVFGVLLHGTVYGRNALAIGGNEEAARLAGVPVMRTRIMIFVVQGVMAALVGVLSTAQMELCHPTRTGVGFELRAISACVLGGVSLTGGVGSIVSVISGVLIMGTVQNAMTLRQMDPFYQNIVTGGILLGAVLLDQLKTYWKARA